MQEYKILFTGAMGAGKTTAIKALSEITPISSDVLNTDLNSDKENTTVGLDYGRTTLKDGKRLRLFGTPGQQRFDFLWKNLIKNTQGLIILIKHTNFNPLNDLGIYLEAFKDNNIPCVIGLTHSEYRQTAHNNNGKELTLDDYATYVAEQGLLIPIVPMDVRYVEDSLFLIDVLFTQMDMSLCATTYLNNNNNNKLNTSDNIKY